jgi:hypothetical protein
MLVDVALGLLMLPNLALPWLDHQYGKICPTEPNEQAGFIYPLREHRTTLYLTLSQHREIVILHTYLAISVPFFCAVGIWKYGLRPKKASGRDEGD